MNTQTRDRNRRPDADEDGFRTRLHPWWLPWIVALVVAALVVGIGSYFAYGRGVRIASMDKSSDGQVLPPVMGYYEGQEISFVHTEASDPQVAGMLSRMMASPVVVVPALSRVPTAALADVFVFANGVKPERAMERGPFGFQPDVFSTVPGDAGYSPLRAVNIVTWQKGQEARILQSVTEIGEAEADGALTVEQPGVVVNMPIVGWPDGKR